MLLQHRHSTAQRVGSQHAGAVAAQRAVRAQPLGMLYTRHTGALLGVPPSVVPAAGDSAANMGARKPMGVSTAAGDAAMGSTTSTLTAATIASPLSRRPASSSS